MTSVRKMYVIPSDFYDSLIQRSKVTIDPIINAQVEAEKEKTKIIKKRKSSDEKMHDLMNVMHKQDVLEEQIKYKKSKPILVEIMPEQEIKKRGRPPKAKETFPEYNLKGFGKTNLLDIFYMYEPKRQ